MTLAWFRSAPLAAAAPLDATADVIRALGQTHEIDVVTAADAHDFVWRHFRTPYALTVFEIGLDFPVSFVRPYAFHYPGVVLLSGAIPRGAGGARLLARLGESARLLVARDPALAERLGDEFPNTPVRHVPLGFGGLGSDEGQMRVRTGSGSGSDAAVVLEWPAAGGSLMPALAAMRARRPLIVYEMEATAGWPAIDPQTGRPRDLSGEPPIAISIDSRDERHSLMLAQKRLAHDAGLRTALTDAAYAWWQRHATLDHAVTGWRQLLDAAAALPTPPPAPWVPDGTASARRHLKDLDASVDFL